MTTILLLGLVPKIIHFLTKLRFFKFFHVEVSHWLGFMIPLIFQLLRPIGLQTAVTNFHNNNFLKPSVIGFLFRLNNLGLFSTAGVKSDGTDLFPSGK